MKTTYEPPSGVLAIIAFLALCIGWALTPLNQGNAQEVPAKKAVANKPAKSQAPLPTSTGFAPENHDGVPGVWFDGPEGFELAKQYHLKTGVPLLTYVYTDWCPYCRKLNSQILTDANVQQCIGKMAKVKINADASEAHRQLATDLRIAGYPSILVRQKDDFMMRSFPTIVPPQQFTAACQAELAKASGGG